jgi:hypothetical protein
LFEGLGPHVGVDPFQHVKQIVVPWTMFVEVHIKDRKSWDEKTIFFYKTEELLDKIVRHDTNNILTIKVYVDTDIAPYMSPTQATVQRLKRRGIHVQFEFHRPGIENRILRVNRVSPVFTSAYEPRLQMFQSAT